MRCNQFKNLIINGEDINLSPDALTHISECKKCSSIYHKTQSTTSLLKKKDVPDFNPYFTERTLAAIANRKSSPIVGRLKSAMIAAIVITTIIGGLTVYMSYSSSQNRSQYYLLSLNDNNIATFALENE